MDPHRRNVLERGGAVDKKEEKRLRAGIMSRSKYIHITIINGAYGMY